MSSFLDPGTFEAVVQIINLVIELVSTLISLQTDGYPSQANAYHGQRFDFIVVGAGSAGCVVANRLTENPDWTVLLIEAGDVPSVASDMPGLYPFLDSSSEDWGHYTVNDGYSSQSVNNGSVHLTHGKVLGGSSSINYMFYVRGNEKDYNQWAQQGNEGWDWPTVLHYFKKSERLNSPEILESETGHLHSTDSYLGVTKSYYKEIEQYLAAFKENDRTILVDTNDLNQIGYSVPTSTIDDGVRQSSAVAFIKSINDRPNLHVLRKTLGRKIIIENNKALGVEVKQYDGTIINLYARKEVILSAGAINSPHILISSGIGPKEELENLGIPVVVNSPHVGKNLQDHAIITFVIKGKEDNTTLRENVQKYLGNLYRFPGPVFTGHIALDNENPVPDYQVFGYPVPASSHIPTLFCAHVLKLDDRICKAIANAGRNNQIVLLNLSYLQPKSRGSVEVTSNNPEVPPSIHTGFFTNYEDLERFADSLEDFLTVLDTPTFKNMNAQLEDLDVKYCKDHSFGSREYYKCFIRSVASTQYHPCCTCRMGQDGVVDHRLKVHGVKSLRVVDASVFPDIVAGNLNAPVIMTGEKAADMIKADYGMMLNV